MTDNGKNYLEKKYNLKQVAVILGVAQITAWREIKRGRLGSYRVAGSLRVGQSHIEKYLRERDSDDAQCNDDNAAA